MGSAVEAEMVLAFLRAEIDSPRFGPYHLSALQQLGFDRRLIEMADLADDGQNAARRRVLGAVRGYGADQFLFRGFPDDARWRRILLVPSDYRRLKYANEETWIILSEGTRLVVVGADNVTKGRAAPVTAHNILEIAKALRAGAVFPELIAIETQGCLILIEGHSRATASCLESTENVQMIVGSSLKMNRWVWI